MRNKQKILIIDDETPFRNALRRILEKDHLVLEADSGDAGLQAASQEEPDLILLDIGLPDASGLDVLPRLKSCVHPHRGDDYRLRTGERGGHGHEAGGV